MAIEIDPLSDEMWRTFGFDFDEDDTEPRIWELPPDDVAEQCVVPAPLNTSSVDTGEPPDETYGESVTTLAQKPKRFLLN
jgi:hypothetical protein